MWKKLFGKINADRDKKSGPSRECRLIEAYLGCECQYIPAGTKQKEVRRIFQTAVEQCADIKRIPVLIAVNDNLAEALFENAGVELPDSGVVSEEDKAKIAAFRDRLISECSVTEAEAFLRDGEEEVGEALEDETFRRDVWESEKIYFNDVIPEIGAFVDLGTLHSRELLLAMIPAAEPWQVAAWLPMGGWNDCPAPSAMLAVAKRWYEKFRAVICTVTSDELEFRVSSPPSNSAEALALAKEFYYFCADRLTQYGSENSLATIAAGVTRSPFWYFWWD